jgi:hypothetical protein
MKTGVVVGIIAVVIMIGIIGYVISQNNTTNQTDTKIASLLKNQIVFESGEASKLFWFPANHPTTIKLLKAENLQLNIYDEITEITNQEIVSTTEEIPGIMKIDINKPGNYYFIEITRPNTQDRFDIEAVISYPNPDIVYSPENLLEGTLIHTPLKEFPTGNDVFSIPPNTKWNSFNDYVDLEYDFNPDVGITFLDYTIEEELQETYCGIPLPPAGDSAPDSAQRGAQHNDNFCGMSVFIHSMNSTFPGSVRADVRTNTTAWDEVGDNLDHSNTVGTRGGKMVDNINKNYRDKISSADGVKYCAAEIDNTSAANLAAWAVDCNVKLLIYDLPEFGHWADITAINGNRFTLQDYDKSYDVTYNESSENIDFSTADRSSVMGKEFQGSDVIAGDDPLERVDFYVVCRCNTSFSTANPPMPTSNSHGTQLIP